MSVNLNKANEEMNMDTPSKFKCQHPRILQRRRSCDSFDSPPLTTDSLTAASPFRGQTGDGSAREIGRRDVLSTQQQKPPQVYQLNHRSGRKYSAGTNEKPNLNSLGNTSLCNPVDDDTSQLGRNKNAVLNHLKANAINEQLFDPWKPSAKKEVINTPRKRHSLGSNEKPNLALLNSATCNACTDDGFVRHFGAASSAESGEKPTSDLLLQDTKSSASNEITSRPRRKYSVGSIQKLNLDLLNYTPTSNTDNTDGEFALQPTSDLLPQDTKSSASTEITSRPRRKYSAGSAQKSTLDLLNYTPTSNTDGELALQRRRKSNAESNEIPTGLFEAMKIGANKETTNRSRRKYSVGSNEKPNSEQLQNMAKLNTEGRFGRRISVGSNERPSFKQADEIEKPNIKTESVSKTENKRSTGINEKQKPYPYEVWKPNAGGKKFMAIPVVHLENHPGRKYSVGKNEKPDLMQLHELAHLNRDGLVSLPATCKPETVQLLAMAGSCCDSASLACSSINFGTSENFLPELEPQPRKEVAAQKLKNIESWLSGL